MVRGMVVSVTTATRSQLKSIGKETTPLGQASLVLAARLDAGADPGSAMAAMAKELRAVLAELAKSAGTVADPVDELKQRRQKRLRA